MSFEFYLVMHLFGVLLVFASLGAGIMLSMNAKSKNFPGRKWVAINHGVGLLIAFIAGMGLVGRLHLFPFPGWVWGKLGIWLFLGAAPALFYRHNSKGKVWWTCLIGIGLLAIYLARYKPF